MKWHEVILAILPSFIRTKKPKLTLLSGDLELRACYDENIIDLLGGNKDARKRSRLIFLSLEMNTEEIICGLF